METFESVMQGMSTRAPSPGPDPGTGSPGPAQPAASTAQPTEEQRKALFELMNEYKDIDVNEAVGDIYQIGFDYVGRKRFEIAKKEEKTEQFNKHAWELNSDQKKKAGRATLVCITLYDIIISPKVFATVILGMTLKGIYDSCKANEYPGEAPPKREKTRQGRSDKGKTRGPQKHPQKKKKK